METEEEQYRITILRSYLFNILDELLNDTTTQINANMLSDDIENYSLDRISVDTEKELPWIIGVQIKKDAYTFRSRKSYSQDTINNLNNVGFFEKFENIINSNNKKGILPDIKNIESIQCLNSGAMKSATTNSAEFNIQIQITYREE